MFAQGQPILLSDGVICYADDADPHRFYCLPSGLSVATDNEGHYRFSLLFYQEDFPERGARLVIVLRPTFPQPSPMAIESVLGSDAEIVGMPFDGGFVQFVWPAIADSPEPIWTVQSNLIQMETSLSQAQGSMLRQLFHANTESVRVLVRLAYPLVTESLPATTRVNLRQLSARMRDQASNDDLSGLQLRTLIAGLPESALEFSRGEPLASLSRQDALWRCTPALGPWIAATTADLLAAGLTFDDHRFRLRPTDQVEDAELWIDLSQRRPWAETWQGEWFMSDFRKQIEIAGELSRYFPEVLHVPVVGIVPVFVENLLSLTPDTIKEVQVTLKHKKLGSLEEEVFDHRFLASTGPVVQHPIPRIAYTPFHYQYKIRLLIAPATPDGLVESLPLNPQWQTTNQPLVRVGLEYMPYAILFAVARTGIFDLVGRVDVEFAQANAEPPTVLARAELSAEQPSRWLLARSLPSTTHAIRWRPVFFADPGGTSSPVYGTWRTETRPWAVLDPWDALPREPKRIQVTVHKGDTPEIHLITVQLRSGTGTADQLEPGVSWSFTGDGTRTLALWPTTIFDTEFVYRIGLGLASGKELLGNWQPGEGDRIEMNVEKDFYFTRQIEVTMKGPWSAQHSPDSSSRKGEVIYAEVYLQLTGTTDTQSRSFTFDIDNHGESFKWTVRGPRGAERYTYRIQVLSLDGHLHPFGPYQSDQEKLALEIVRTSVSDIAPPTFDVREVTA